MSEKLLECVPNFSEGRNPEIIDKIVNEVKTTKGVTMSRDRRNIRPNVSQSGHYVSQNFP